MGVNNLPKVVTRQRGGQGSNSRPLSHQSDALAIVESPIAVAVIFIKIQMVVMIFGSYI